MIDYINIHCRSHIVTIEDPIEFTYLDKLSSVCQRELGTDTSNFDNALKASLRQDPDVIMIGELRDFVTIQTALTASETGHLVMSTLHTNSAAQSIDRIIDSFPPEAKNQVRIQLASTLLAIVSQRMIPRADGSGQIVAVEILIKSPSVERLILENKLDEIESMMETSASYYKMQTMNQCLAKLINDGVIDLEEAVRHSDKPEDLRLKLSGMMSGGQRDFDANDLLSQREKTLTGPRSRSGAQNVYVNEVELELDDSDRDLDESA